MNPRPGLHPILNQHGLQRRPSWSFTSMILNMRMQLPVVSVLQAIGVSLLFAFPTVLAAPIDANSTQTIPYDLFNSTLCYREGPNNLTQLLPLSHHNLINSHHSDTIFHAYANTTYTSPSGIWRAGTNSTNPFVTLLAFPRMPSSNLTVTDKMDWDTAFICSTTGGLDVVKEEDIQRADMAIEHKCWSRETGYVKLGGGAVYGRVVFSDVDWASMEKWVSNLGEKGLCAGLK
ncbi:hypothetical protein BJ508DRAFT_136597 [Ascobolus immersus RN42]|uniref:Uncharacterized protein n=1 Tax=Ascobolus immersus RN42 TaxID=1160509 RepID=A0A3N4I139_ASCIM|nr:hypothetical protein BJ508DRAFT_136597 [Ascobolus immersus RN42]